MATVPADFFSADGETFRKGAQEPADSRLWAGIHFKIDDEVGLALGKAVGQLVFERLHQNGQ